MGLAVIGLGGVLLGLASAPWGCLSCPFPASAPAGTGVALARLTGSGSHLAHSFPFCLRRKIPEGENESPWLPFPQAEKAVQWERGRGRKNQAEARREGSWRPRGAVSDLSGEKQSEKIGPWERELCHPAWQPLAIRGYFNLI